jgi:hypothetical protein
VATVIAARVKQNKAPMKARLHLSTVAVKIQRLEDAEEDEVLIVENEPVAQIAFVTQLSDKKKVIYITR